MLRFTGHPFIDVGVATITAYAGVDNPAHITASQVAGFKEWAVELYMNPVMANYLGYVVFANLYPFNPGITKKEQFVQQRYEVLSALFDLYMADETPTILLDRGIVAPIEPNEFCMFSGDPAIVRASRTIIPMTGSEDAINFVPEGRPRLAIAGWCVLALLAMPLGCLNSNGKMWLIHSMDSDVTLSFALVNLERNWKAFQMQGIEKLPNYKFAKTHLMQDLVEAQRVRVSGRKPLSAYLFTSSGQKSEIDIHHLPSNVLSFVTSAQNLFPEAWRLIVERAWYLLEDPIENEDGKTVDNRRNYFYEDIFDLPHSAVSFLRRYLLRQPLSGKATGKQKLDPRYSYSYITEKEVISWGLTDLFLERIMHMDKDRIQAIRDLGDALAEFIYHRDQRLFVRLFNARNDYQMRLELLKAFKDTGAPKVTYDQFITVFFIDEGDTVKPDWYLARDLLMVRIIERLHAENWIEAHQDLVEEANQANEEE